MQRGRKENHLCVVPKDTGGYRRQYASQGRVSYQYSSVTATRSKCVTLAPSVSAQKNKKRRIAPAGFCRSTQSALRSGWYSAPATRRKPCLIPASTSACGSSRCRRRSKRAQRWCYHPLHRAPGQRQWMVRCPQRRRGLSVDRALRRTRCGVCIARTACIRRCLPRWSWTTGGARGRGALRQETTSFWWAINRKGIRHGVRSTNHEIDGSILERDGTSRTSVE